MATFIATMALYVLGGTLNRIRGTSIKSKKKIAVFINQVNKWLFAVAYGALQGFYDIRYLGLDAVSKDAVYDAKFSLALAFFHFTAMRVGYASGWDVGPLWGNPPKKQDNLLDGIDPDRFKDSPVLRCVYRLSMRGLLWGWLLALPLHSFYPMLAGLLMGPTYWFCTLGPLGMLCRKIVPGLDRHGVCEVVFGGIILVSTFL